MKATRHTAAAACGAATSMVLSIALLALQTTTASAGGPTVSGAGSTWVQIALDQWRADIAQQGLTINYTPNGSSTGRSWYIANQADFAASEIPFYPFELQQLQAENKSFQYVPDVAGGTSLMYNLHHPDGSRITTLRLDATAAARIFTGGLTSWQDPAIATLNPGLTISETNILPVTRSDGSGTSAQFSLYLASQAAGVWNAFVSAYGCAAPCSQWPQFPGSTSQQGSDGVANFVSNDALGAGSIGYVEAGFAFGRAFPIASLHNASGSFAPAQNDPVVFSHDVATALNHATLNADLTQNLGGVYTAPEANAYPMSSYSYLITQTTGFDPAKGNVLGTWMIYIACAGQREATPLGYSPMPPNLIQDVFNAVHRIPGAPATPPIDAQHCPNPTLTSTSTAPGASGSGARGGKTAGTAASHNAAAAAAAAAASAAGVAAPAAGGLTGGAGGSSAVGATAVPTMSAVQRAASFVLAEQVATHATPVSSVQLLLAAVTILLGVFIPAMVLRRRAR